MSKVLVTGGAGYIGSHTVLQLLENGYEVVVLDNLYNGSEESLCRVQRITNKNINFVKGDVRDESLLLTLFEEHELDLVIHFAGLKAVGESVQQPLQYYQNNVGGTISLCKVMAQVGVKRIIFSSSATVYGEDAPVPYFEHFSRGKTSSPYAASKAIVEQLLEDLVASDPNWSAVLLRYFNPVGAHETGLIGEDPIGLPNNLMPFISQVAAGKRSNLFIFGSDYPTRDGTCERDYIHVMDVAEGHLAAMKCCNTPGLHRYNLGTGRAVSVLEIVENFQRTTGVAVPYEFAARRLGDLASFWADATKAKNDLGWQPKRTLTDMMRDTWRWQKNNPLGYRQNDE